MVFVFIFKSYPISGSPMPFASQGRFTRKNACGLSEPGAINWRSEPFPMRFV